MMTKILMEKSNCPHCTRPLSVIDRDTLRFCVGQTKANVRGDGHRQGKHVAICPPCDAYALMADFTWGVPFYSRQDQAVVTIHDYGAADAAGLLEFGNLPFTRNALNGALEMLREQAAADLPRSDAIGRLNRKLLGPTGIPNDKSAGKEWGYQIIMLAAKFKGQFSLSEVDAAIRSVIKQVPSSAD